MNKSKVPHTLQNKASDFLKRHYLVVNDIKLYPKEIEVYYYKEGVFEDGYVHRDSMQLNRSCKFYVHRKGRGGCDFVLSDSEDVYYSYLIRSVVIGDDLFVGPINSYEAILAKTGLSGRQLEQATVTVGISDREYNVLRDSRIGLTPKQDIDPFYLDAELRFILCDEYFRPRHDKRTHYKRREKAFVKFMLHKMSNQRTLTMNDVVSETKYYLGYIPKTLKIKQSSNINE